MVAADLRRPQIVLVTGAPGSGKTTLGSLLSRELHVPFLARDDVRRGLYFTSGAWSDRPEPVPPGAVAVDTFLRILETMAGLGVSCVVEYVVRRARPEDLARLIAAGNCVVVHAHCADAMARVAERARADRLLTRQAVLDSLGFAGIDDHTEATIERMQSVTEEMQTEFDGLPVLLVATDDGYDPGVDAIVDFVTA